MSIFKGWHIYTVYTRLHLGQLTLDIRQVDLFTHVLKLTAELVFRLLEVFGRQELGQHKALTPLLTQLRVGLN